MTQYRVLKPLTYNAVKYNKGDILKHKLGIRDQQILKSMVSQRRIEVTAAAVVPPPPSTETVGTLTDTGSGWFVVTVDGCDSKKLKGQKAVKEYCDENTIKLLTE